MREMASRHLLSQFLFMSSLLRLDFREVTIWTAWFLVVAFFNSLTLLCRDRFMRITLAPVTSVKEFSRPLALLAATQGGNMLCAFIWAVVLYPNAGLSLFMVVLYECSMLEAQILEVLAKYVFEVVF